MVGVAISQQLRAFHSSLQLPSLKMSSSSSSSSSLTKTLIHTLFTSQLRRLTRVLTTARSFLVEVFSKRSSSSSHPPVHFFIYFTRNKKNKIHFGSFRMHYNWCSSRSWSVPASVLTELPAAAGATDSQRHAYYDTMWQCEDPAAAESHRHAYYDATWQFEEVVGGDLYNDPSELSGYLRWLEEKKVAAVDDGGARNEIDELADMFIAQCREKFILEKQESERKFKEMLARSM